MINKPIDSTPRDMWESESIQRFIEGLKVSASCCRELHALEPKSGWDKVYKALIELISQGRKLSKVKALTRGALLDDAARIQFQLNPTMH